MGRCSSEFTFAYSTSLSDDTNIHRKLEDGDKNEIENLRLPRQRKSFYFFFFSFSALSLWVGGIRNPLQVGFSLLCHRRERNCFSFTKMADKMVSIHKSSARFFLKMKKLFKVALCCWMGRVCCKRWFMCWWKEIFLCVPWKTVGEHCSFQAPRIEARMKLFQLNFNIALSLHRIITYMSFRFYCDIVRSLMGEGKGSLSSRLYKRIH